MSGPEIDDEVFDKLCEEFPDKDFQDVVAIAQRVQQIFLLDQQDKGDFSPAEVLSTMKLKEADWERLLKEARQPLEEVRARF